MRKMDEMERQHSLYAIRNTYGFTMMFEVLYFLIECIQAGAFVAKESPMFFLMICQGIVLSLSTFVFKIKVDDHRGLKSLIVSCLLAVAAIAVGYMLT